MDSLTVRRLMGQDVLDQPLLPQPGNIWADVLPTEQAVQHTAKPAVASRVTASPAATAHAELTDATAPASAPSQAVASAMDAPAPPKERSLAAPLVADLTPLPAFDRGATQQVPTRRVAAGFMVAGLMADSVTAAAPAESPPPAPRPMGPRQTATALLSQPASSALPASAPGGSDRAANDQPANGQPTNDRVANDRPSNGQPANDQAVNDQAANKRAATKRVGSGPVVPNLAVQLAAAGSAQRAAAEWRRLQQGAPDLTDGHAPAVSEAEVNGRQVWRLRTTGFAGLAEASAFCTSIRTIKADCWVVPAPALP